MENRLTEKEKELLRKFNLPTDFRNLEDDEYFRIGDFLFDEMMSKGRDDSGNELNEYGLVVDEIIAKLTECD